MKILSAILLISTISFSQENHSFEFCEVYAVAPTIVGGLDSVQMLLNWPEQGKQIDFEGKIFILAYLDSLGKLDSASVIKGFGFGFNEEALRVVKLVKFTPAYRNKLISPKHEAKSEYILVPIPSKITIPITFKRM
jgi:TonB family protein